MKIDTIIVIGIFLAVMLTFEWLSYRLLLRTISMAFKRIENGFEARLTEVENKLETIEVETTEEDSDER